MDARLTLVLGGVRSGKSAFAEQLIQELDRPTVYLATSQVTDSEMAERIRRHRASRPGHWTTIEEPLELVSALGPVLAQPAPPGVVLVESLDVWASNLLLHHEEVPSGELESLALCQVDQLLQLCRQSPAAFVLVSSEVGLSLVPPNALGRRFQDLLGLVNQRVAAAADRVYLVVAGIPVKIKPSGRTGNQGN